MITEQNHAHRIWQAHRTLYFRTQLNQLHKTVQAAINEFRNESLNNFVESLLTENNRIRKAVPHIHKTCTHILAINSPEHTNAEKAKVFLKVLEVSSHLILI